MTYIRVHNVLIRYKNKKKEVKSMDRYQSKASKDEGIMPTGWCPCEGSCSARCVGSCKTNCGGGCEGTCLNGGSNFW